MGDRQLSRMRRWREDARATGVVMLKFPKPQRGSRVLAKEQADAEAATIEKREKGAAKKRDGRCRWPEAHKCRLGLEAAHIQDASLGGPMDRRNLVTVCAWLHRRGPESIHGKQLQVRCETADGAQGPLSFWRQQLDGSYYLVAREIALFRYERD
jgi:hypothetical protein